MSEYPLPVAEQTMLDDPIKVGWSQRTTTRQQFAHSLQTAFAEADASQPLAGAGYRALQRQKTNVVILTVEEAESLLYELNQYLAPFGIDPPANCTTDTYERVLNDLSETLAGRGYVLDGSDRSPTIQTPDGEPATVSPDLDPEAEATAETADDPRDDDPTQGVSHDAVASTMRELNVDPDVVLDDIERAPQQAPDEDRGY